MSWLAGEDSTRRTGLPANELLAPLPLLAMILLVVNDRVLKGSSVPGWLTGKLSDVVGLFAFTLVVTAAIDVGLFAASRLGTPVDHTLRRAKLLAAIVLTAIVFTAMKLSPVVADLVELALGTLVRRTSSIALDPTDIACVPVLAATWWYGTRTIARVPYGRLALVRERHARGRPMTTPFADVRACGANAESVAALEQATAAWLANPADENASAVDAALRSLRSRSRPSA